MIRAIWDGAGGTVMAFVAAIPLWGVRAAVIASFIGIAIWAMTMPRAYAFKGAPSQAWYYDVRIWAVVVLGIEILPYAFF